jgi:hypothetical protein
MARPGKGLKGIDNVMRNINKEFSKMKTKGTTGMIKAAIVIRRDMDKTPPLIPVDLGNLRFSWFITTGRPVVPGGNFKGEPANKMSGDHSKVVTDASARAKAVPFPALIMGLSANYALAIHEKQADFKRPGSGRKFFESALKRNQNTMLQLIANEIKF